MHNTTPLACETCKPLSCTRLANLPCMIKPLQQTGRRRAQLVINSSSLYEDYETRHTLTSLYLPKTKQPNFKKIDHHAKRIEKDIKEVAEAGKKLGITEAQLLENLTHIQSLLPDFRPNLFKMKASEWAKVLSNVPTVADIIITFKTLYPGVNASKVMKHSPRLLLQNRSTMEQHARQVRAMLVGVEEVDVNAVMEAVPSLMDPYQLSLSLSNLRTWFPNQDPIHMLVQDPTKLLNIDEADLEADPLYGRSFW